MIIVDIFFKKIKNIKYITFTNYWSFMKKIFKKYYFIFAVLLCFLDKKASCNNNKNYFSCYLDFVPAFGGLFTSLISDQLILPSFEVTPKVSDENEQHQKFVKKIAEKLFVEKALGDILKSFYSPFASLVNCDKDSKIYESYAKVFGKGIKNISDFKKLISKFKQLSSNVKNKAVAALALNCAIRYGLDKGIDFGGKKLESLSKGKSCEEIAKTFIDITKTATDVYVVDPLISLTSMLIALNLTGDLDEQDELLEIVEEGKVLKGAIGVGEAVLGLPYFSKK